VQVLLALKNRVCSEFTVLNIYFLSFRILNNLRLPWKTEFGQKIFTVLKYFLSFRIFEQLELALKNRIWPENFHCIEIFFIFQIFWATWACPENRVCPEFFKPGDGRPPRLVRHSDSMIIFVTLLPGVVSTLEELQQENKQVEFATKAATLLNSVQKCTFLIAALVMQYTSGIILPVSKLLQKK